jgi:Domain of unknown function (DUF6134)
MPQGPQSSGAVTRREMVGGLLAAGGILAAGTALARSVSGPHPRRMAFDILRDGDSIGGHEVAFQHHGDRLEVDIVIEISVSLAFIPVFAYRHRNHEVWQHGRLVALDSTTDDDGQHFSVTARALDDGLHVIGSDGDILAPADILPTSYWDARTVVQSRLLDSQRGRLLEVEPRYLGEEMLESGAVARRHRLSGDIDLDLWYAPGGEWLKIAFQVRGAEVSYARRLIDGGEGAPG